MSRKLNKNAPYEEVFGHSTKYKYMQDGKYFRACGSQCDEDGNFLGKRTPEQKIEAFAEKNLALETEKPFILPERLAGTPDVRKVKREKK